MKACRPSKGERDNGFQQPGGQRVHKSQFLHYGKKYVRRNGPAGSIYPPRKYLNPPDAAHLKADQRLQERYDIVISDGHGNIIL